MGRDHHPCGTRLKADERRAVQDRLSAALVEWAPGTVRRYRAIKTRELVGAYYAKADADGRALRTRVVTAALRPTIVAYFRGDWLALAKQVGAEKVFFVNNDPVIVFC